MLQINRKKTNCATKSRIIITPRRQKVSSPPLNAIAPSAAIIRARLAAISSLAAAVAAFIPAIYGAVTGKSRTFVSTTSPCRSRHGDRNNDKPYTHGNQYTPTVEHLLPEGCELRQPDDAPHLQCTHRGQPVRCLYARGRRPHRGENL